MIKPFRIKNRSEQWHFGIKIFGGSDPSDYNSF